MEKMNRDFRVGMAFQMTFTPSVKRVRAASEILRKVFPPTPLQFSAELSTKHNAKVYLKREDLTPVRSYKIRGAYMKMNDICFGMSGLSSSTAPSVVTCSAGNHAQGVAFSCNAFQVRGDIFMPKNTTQQKIHQVQRIGGNFVKIFLEGDNFDECQAKAKEHCVATSKTFMHPFDDEKVIDGQGTVGLEILEQIPTALDYVFLPIGGGGLAAGVSSYIRDLYPVGQIFGAGPLGAPAMYQSLLQNAIVQLDTIDTFVDGASVKRVGERNFPIIQTNLKSMFQIEEGHICSKILEMYNDYGMILEPAGVLSLCAMDCMDLTGKVVVAVLSGGNSDVFRMPEILERSLLYEGKKHYFRIEFSQRAGALKEFVLNVLEKDDDIIYFRYTKRLSLETGPVILGIETKTKQGGMRLEKAMNAHGLVFQKLRGKVDL